MFTHPFSRQITPDWEAFIDCVSRKGTPARVHHIELFLDEEMKQAICKRFNLLAEIRQDDPYFIQRREIILQRFLGYDYVLCGLENVEFKFDFSDVEDTAGLKRAGGRGFVNQHSGPITNWQEFDTYPWPDMTRVTSQALEWYTRNLPDDMCIIGGLTGHIFENLSFLMGFETLCISLYEQRDLVEAIIQRCLEIDAQVVARLLEFDRVRVIWGSDDLGFRSGLLIKPNDMRSLVLPGHRRLAGMAHSAGRLYFLHSCGKLAAIMDELITEVKIDARHSFEDTIQDVREAKTLYGEQIALLGGIDLDFLCGASPTDIRQRVHDTLSVCQPGGGYCLGTGNTVANYIPLDNYLAMLDEGRKFS